MPCGTLSEGGWEYVDRELYYSETGGCNPQEVWVNTWSAPVLHESKTTTGQCIPNYHAKRKRGELIPHTYFSQTETSISRGGSYDVSVDDTDGCGAKTLRYWYTPVWFHDTAPPTEEEISDIENSIDHQQMIQAAYADAHGKFDALTFVAELAKTVAMFKNVGNLFNKILSKSPSDKAEAYLEARYGWRVLFYEMKSLEEATVALSKKYQLVTGRAGHTWSASSMWTHNHDFGWATFDIDYTQEIILGVRGSCALRTALKTPFITNPAVTAWELTTYSFVIDWFVNIGNVISAFSAYIAATDQTASSGYEIQIIRENQMSNLSWQLGRYGTLDSWYKYHLTKQVRIPGSVSFTPQINPNLNAFKIADLVALVVVGFQRWRK